MKTSDPRLAERLIALVAAGAFLLNFPLLGLLSDGGRLFGVPALYFYLFGVWLALIVLFALISDPPGTRAAPPASNRPPDA
jgi:hypothetical protein